MKKLNVYIDTFYGYDCAGCGYSNNGTCQIEISDEISTLLEAKMQEMQVQKLSFDDIEAMIDGGHACLFKLAEDIHLAHRELSLQYWNQIAENDPSDDEASTIDIEDIDNEEYSATISFVK